MKMDDYLLNDIYRLQVSVQNDFKQHEKILSKQFLVEEDNLIKFHLGVQRKV